MGGNNNTRRIVASAEDESEDEAGQQDIALPGSDNTAAYASISFNCHMLAEGVVIIGDEARRGTCATLAIATIIDVQGNATRTCKEMLQGRTRKCHSADDRLIDDLNAA